MKILRFNVTHIYVGIIVFWDCKKCKAKAKVEANSQNCSFKNA